jgi:hypothetical protein
VPRLTGCYKYARAKGPEQRRSGDAGEEVGFQHEPEGVGAWAGYKGGSEDGDGFGVADLIGRTEEKVEFVQTGVPIQHGDMILEGAISADDARAAAS